MIQDGAGLLIALTIQLRHQTGSEFDRKSFMYDPNWYDNDKRASELVGYSLTSSAAQNRNTGFRDFNTCFRSKLKRGRKFFFLAFCDPLTLAQRLLLFSFVFVCN